MDMIHVYAATLDCLTEAGLKNVLEKMGNVDLVKLAGYWNQEDKNRMVLGRLLLSLALKDINFPLEIKDISFSQFGRPMLEGEIDFNISHSKNWVVCAITSYDKIGIDIEACEKVNIKDFTSCFNWPEWRKIEQNNNMITFYNFWTKKEASIKANGKGLSIPLSEVAVIEDKKVSVYTDIWNITRVHLDSHYVCHLASTRKEPKVKIKIFKRADLQKRFLENKFFV